MLGKLTSQEFHMVSSINDVAILNNGTKMPWLGFGVYKIQEGQNVESSVAYVIEKGYRSIDTAAIYNNERGVGKAIRKSGLPRTDIFLTTKVWNDDQRNGTVALAFEESLRRLETDYVDLYLIHWPVNGCYQKTWKEMEKIYQSGRARSIGVSNFQIHHLEDIMQESMVAPSVNQIEFHPLLVQPDLLRFCKRHNIFVEAWSPLMQGYIVTDQTICNLAAKYNRTPAQIVLRWDLQHEVVTIPKSTHPDRIVENSLIFDFEITDEDMALIDKLDKRRRIGPDPDNFNF
jgi:diketogulonate reductase-like aldo/keto reductase